MMKSIISDMIWLDLTRFDMKVCLYFEWWKRTKVRLKAIGLKTLFIFCKWVLYLHFSNQFVYIIHFITRFHHLWDGQARQPSCASALNHTTSGHSAWNFWTQIVITMFFSEIREVFKTIVFNLLAYTSCLYSFRKSGLQMFWWF